MGLPKATKISLLKQRLCHRLVIPEELAELGHNGSWGEAIHADPTWAKLSGKGLGEAKQ